MSFTLFEICKLIGFTLLLLVLSTIIFLLSYLLSVSAPEIEKVSSYECKFNPYKDAKIVFNPVQKKYSSVFNFSDMKTYFANNVQSFCFKRSHEIFAAFCFGYFLFLFCLLNTSIAVIIFFCSAILYTATFFLLQLKVPVVECFSISTLIVSILHLPISDTKQLCFCLFCILYYFALICSFLGSTSIELKVQTFLKNLKEANEILSNHQVTDFFYFKVVSTLISCVILSLLLIKKVFNIESYLVLFQTLPPQEQEIILVLFLSLCLILLILAFIDGLIIHFFNTRILGSLRYFMHGKNAVNNIVKLTFAGVVLGGLDRYISHPEISINFPGFSMYRILKSGGFDWLNPSDLSLAAEYSELTNGLPPPVCKNTRLLDSYLTGERVNTLRGYKNSQLAEMTSFILTKPSPSTEDIILFGQKQALEKSAFVGIVHTGQHRAVSSPEN